MKLLPTKILNNMVIQLGPDKSCCNITLHRTLRIPDDGKIYPLPPSLGMYPLCKVDDYKEKVPKKWLKQGGVFFPMYQREAMWLKFDVVGTTPKAIKVAVGKINALSGKTWKNELQKQDYCVAPNQEWLDGINSGDKHIRQFVAMPLGSGYTVEGQVTGKETFGGVQLLMYDSKSQKITKPKPKPKPKPVPRPYPGPIINPGPFPGPFPPYPPVCMSAGGRGGGFGGGGYSGNPRGGLGYGHNVRRAARIVRECECDDLSHSFESFNDRGLLGKKKEKKKSSSKKGQELGLASGGKMKQLIKEDSYGLYSWNQKKFARLYIHIVNSEMYKAITGKSAPSCPISAKTYTDRGYPWLDIYEEKDSGVKKSSILKNVKSVKQKDHEKYAWPQQDDETVRITNVKVIGKEEWPKKDKEKEDPNVVRDGEW